MSEDEDEFKAQSLEHEIEIMLGEFGEYALGHAVGEMERALTTSDHGTALYWLKVIRGIADSLVAPMIPNTL